LLKIQTNSALYNRQNIYFLASKSVLSPALWHTLIAQVRRAHGSSLRLVTGTASLGSGLPAPWIVRK
jgi:uncharacterized protein YjeT (DUF2065 family)